MRSYDVEMVPTDNGPWCLKSEVDAYIRHHKYKRCLAMAEHCKDRIENPVQYDEHDDWLIIDEYWKRWHKRWLKLAEKFKEGV